MTGGANSIRAAASEGTNEKRRRGNEVGERRGKSVIHSGD